MRSPRSRRDLEWHRDGRGKPPTAVTFRCPVRREGTTRRRRCGAPPRHEVEVGEVEIEPEAEASEQRSPDLNPPGAGEGGGSRDPARSNAAIVAETGVAEKTVAKARHELQASGELAPQPTPRERARGVLLDPANRSLADPEVAARAECSVKTMAA